MFRGSTTPVGKQDGEFQDALVWSSCIPSGLKPIDFAEPAARLKPRPFKTAASSEISSFAFLPDMATIEGDSNEAERSGREGRQ